MNPDNICFKGYSFSWTGFSIRVVRFVIFHFLIPVGQKMLLHVPDPGKHTSTFCTNVRFFSDPSEWHPREFSGQIRISMNKTVLLQVAIPSKLSVAVRALVRFLHAASVRDDCKVIKTLFSPLSVHLKVLFHVSHA